MVSSKTILTKLLSARRFKWIYLAPVLVFISLAAWAFASPIGSGPDDDYHLVSTWCADGGSQECQPGSKPNIRVVDSDFRGVVCYAQHQNMSAECQYSQLGQDLTYETDRGNFLGEYPPVYYAVTHLFAGSDIQVSALVMRLFNAALFVGLTTALFLLLPPRRRQTLLWGWLIAVIPLGIFLIPSNNPSGWAITGIGTAFLALLGWFETVRKRHWALGLIYLAGMIMAAGARGDAAVYAIGATATAMILTSEKSKSWALGAILPSIGALIAVIFILTAYQTGTLASGFAGGEVASLSTNSVDADSINNAAISGFALAAYNLLMLPYLWTGVWGTWALGWLDTGMPAIVPWAAVAVFMVVGFAGLGHLNWRKAISLGGVLVVLVVLPVYVLTVGGTKVGVGLQPRYLLPLILLFCLLLVSMPGKHSLKFSRIQTVVVLIALALANLVALQVNIRRYVTGADQQGFNLDAGTEWWWRGFPIGPIWVWLIGTVAFVGLLLVLWKSLTEETNKLMVSPLKKATRSSGSSVHVEGDVIGRSS